MLVFSPEVAQAFANGQPVVALESTLISHGLPYPGNRELALNIESDIRDAGCVPATIAVLSGQIHIGLSAEHIEFLATDKTIIKLNAADVALCVASGRSGATTVAGTMFCAHRAGIRFFATGGIGGVHRGAENSFDISQDLTTFKNTPVAVVTAGAKSLLDLPKTLEVLETLGVPVVGYQTDKFPSFWSRSSGLPLLWRADTPAEMAAFAAGHWALNPECGLIIANPIPAADEIPAVVIENALTAALAAAAQDGITGKAVTPYLLGKIRAFVPASLLANISLIRHNARTAAAIAAAHAGS